MTRRARRRLALSLGISAIIAVALSIALWNGFFKTQQALATDVLFQTWTASGMQEVEQNIVIVSIDDASLRKLGRFSDWPRRYYAQMVDKLREAYARVITFDVGFIEPQADDPQVAEAVKRFLALGPEELQKAGVAPNRRSVIMPLIGKAGGAPATTAGNPPTFIDSDRPQRVYLDAISALAHANVLPDDDGSVRKAALLIRVNDEQVPSLAFASAGAYTNRSVQRLDVDSEGHLIAVGRYIPIDPFYQMIISFAGPPSKVGLNAPHTFTAISLVDVIEGRVDPAVFRDKMVFVGLLGAPGFADDYWVPTSKGVGKMDGVEIHANSFATLVSARFFAEQQFPVTVAILVLVCLVTGLAAATLSIVPSALVALLVGLLYLVGALGYSELYFDQLGVAIPNMIYPPTAILLTFLCVTIYRVVFEQAETRATRGAMGKYLSPAVLSAVLKDPDALKLGGEKRIMTALFTDIRGFTSISEKLEPQALVALLNEYLTDMTDVVHKWEGVLDKYMGDAIMAWWGAPGEQPDHAYRACRTALGMRQDLGQLHVAWQERGVPGHPDAVVPFLEMGVGVNTGPMVYGNTGSHDRFDFTVLGDAVNLASRLEGVNKEYGSNVIISESTLDQLRLAASGAATSAGAEVGSMAANADGSDASDSGGVAIAVRPTDFVGPSNEGHDFVVRPLDLIAVKGKTEPVQIYQLIGMKGEVAPEVTELVESWESAMGLYRQRRFADAAQAFDEILDRFPDERPTPERPITPSGVYAERCRDLAKDPPPADWDGVFVMTHK